MTSPGEKTTTTDTTWTAGADTPAAPAAAGVPAQYRYDWGVFTDWCTAADTPALPAGPETLAEFLADHPAAVGTQRRRITAINHVHTACGLPAPGNAEPIRALLDARRAARVARVARMREYIDEIVAALPVTGWPAGLFGRRDAAILVLAGAGLSYAEIARLRRRDITTTDSAVTVTAVGRVPVTLPAGGADVVRRWCAVIGFAEAHPSTRALADRLENNTLPPVAGRLPGPAAAVFTRIDQWGHLPLAPLPLSAASIGAITRAHLTGTAPPHAISPREPRGDEGPPPEATATATTNPAPARLGAYYEAGIAARRRDHTRLAGLDTLIDDINMRADRILERTLGILDDDATRAGVRTGVS